MGFLSAFHLLSKASCYHNPAAFAVTEGKAGGKDFRQSTRHWQFTDLKQS